MAKRDRSARAKRRLEERRQARARAAAAAAVVAAAEQGREVGLVVRLREGTQRAQEELEALIATIGELRGARAVEPLLLGEGA